MSSSSTPARPRGHERRLIAAALGSMVCFGAFFLPWVDGTGRWAGRSFSGIEIAELVERYAGVTSSPAVVTATIGVYLVPFCALDGLGVALLGLSGRLERRVAHRALVVIGAYPLLVAVIVGVIAIRAGGGLEEIRLGLLAMGGAGLGIAMAGLGAGAARDRRRGDLAPRNHGAPQRGGRLIPDSIVDD